MRIGMTVMRVERQLINENFKKPNGREMRGTRKLFTKQSTD